MTRRLGAALCGFVLVGALAACGDVSNGATPQTPGSPEAATAVGGVPTLTVVAGDDLRFQQTALTAPPGPVKIVLDVVGKRPHDLEFVDGSEGGTSELSQGEDSVVLTFAHAGTYHFLCTVHPGMQGTLTIS